MNPAIIQALGSERNRELHQYASTRRQGTRSRRLPRVRVRIPRPARSPEPARA